ncbi:MAG: hypothetical protein E7589_01290 [Ruminococcaceae bacterium]|nr:hypothetical protein [Oscillospiraceae bacterium]
MSQINSSASTIPVKKGEKMVTVRIHKERDDTQTHLFVSVGERNFMIQKGVDVEVPECVAKLLAYRDKRLAEYDRHLESLKK